MANTIDSALNGTLISQAALEAFTGSFAPMNAFATDFDPAPASKSDTIQVPYVPAATAATDFVAANGYTRQDSTLQKKTITLNKHKFVSWTVTDLESAKSPTVSLERFGRQKGFQLAKAVFQDVLSAVTLANYGAAAFTGAAGTFDYADVVDIKGACDSAEMPENPRALVLASGHYNALLKDSVVKDLSVYGLNSNQTGRVGRLAGFDLFDSTLVPANAQNLVGFACYPSALVVAMRYLNPAGGGGDGVYRPVADENTGITLGYREWYDNDLGTRVAVLEAFYGYSVGEAAALKRLVSA
jgi:hypothetical protein